MTVDLHHVEVQVFLVHELFRTYRTLKRNGNASGKLIISPTLCRVLCPCGAGRTLWGMSPVWETTCKRSSSFPLNEAEHVRQVCFCRFNTAQTLVTNVSGKPRWRFDFLTHRQLGTVSDLVYQEILLPEVPLSTLQAAKGPLAGVPPATKTR